MSAKIHKCHIASCEASFCRPSKLQIHLRKHTGERPFACNKCDKTYTNDSHLRRHKSISHSSKNPADTIQCSYKGCHQMLANKLCLKKHVYRNHTDSNRYEHRCTMCNKSFRKKTQLSAHIFQHTGKPQFTCELCNMGFVTVAQFHKHKHRHKIYKCKCSSEFDKWSKLLKHRKTCSTYLQKFKCEECGKTCANKRNFKQHKNEIHHDRDHVYECPVEDCERFYKYKRNLYMHVRYFHSEKQRKKLTCPLPECTKTFLQQRYIKSHIEKHAKLEHKAAEPAKLETAKPKRQPRKDKGHMKRSVALYMTGLKVPYEAEKKILKRQNIELFMEDDSESNSTEYNYDSDNSIDSSKDVIDLGIELSSDEELHVSEEDSDDVLDTDIELDQKTSENNSENENIDIEKSNPQSLEYMDAANENVSIDTKHQINKQFTENLLNKKVHKNGSLVQLKTKHQSHEEDLLSDVTKSNKSQGNGQTDENSITSSGPDPNISHTNFDFYSEEKKLKAVAEILGSVSKEFKKTVNNGCIEDLAVDSSKDKRTRSLNEEIDSTNERKCKRTKYSNKSNNVLKNKELDINGHVSNIELCIDNTKNFKSKNFKVRQKGNNVTSSRKCSEQNIGYVKENHESNIEVSKSIKPVLKVYLERCVIIQDTLNQSLIESVERTNLNTCENRVPS